MSIHGNRSFWLLVAGLTASVLFGQFRPDIPKAWNEEALRAMTVPPRGLSTPVRYPPADWFYRIPEHPIYRVYPVYHPDKEPPNYMALLSVQTPEIAFDTATLKTEFDWLQAGEAVFSSAGATGPLTPDDLHNPEVWKKFHFQADAEGALPGWRYVVRQRGKVEVAQTLCGACHEGTVEGRMVAGVPGTWHRAALTAYTLRRQLNRAPGWDVAGRQEVARQVPLFSVPWLTPDPAARVARLAPNQFLAVLDSLSGGVVPQSGTSLFFPPRIPDLIGVRERKYLGATGLYRHQGIGDLMRYAVLETEVGEHLQYGEFRPAGPLPDPGGLDRLSDAQLYALALYIYGLKPPRNPNRLDNVAKRGQKIFDREGCAECHAAPEYTNQRAMPPDGTDARLTEQTRKGTGNYRVPSLKGVWYRGLFEHSGSVESLEDWFDATRLSESYVATGFREYGVEARPVPGHRHGLKLSFEERRALMAFLRTL